MPLPPAATSMTEAAAPRGVDPFSGPGRTVTCGRSGCKILTNHEKARHVCACVCERESVQVQVAPKSASSTSSCRCSKNQHPFSFSGIFWHTFVCICSDRPQESADISWQVRSVVILIAGMRRDGRWPENKLRLPFAERR